MKKLVLVVGIALVLTGCATGMSPVGTGLITDVKGPIAVGDATGTKEGTACAKTIVGLINSGDASIEAAKKAGGIKSVASVDYHTKGFYPFMGQTCTIVTGS